MSRTRPPLGLVLAVRVTLVAPPGGSVASGAAASDPAGAGDEWLRWFPKNALRNVRWIRILTTSSPSWVGWGEVQVD